ncbi:unnamed protein product [Vitrella brassicaformis CCMP3155]|uniref:RRM domain-containing protein n=2 Tax=Vitrella brassicaformis TaxID=1169539 RepID=A0A0G4FVX2_VITBC|nr:unnamed protein product [Vitrella brassicaformis CCMP3155]|mmetsp:Transcript_13378/g.31929  ORF Transcript_13378/g.31929 Transcript_13378/m.31929 type:complete len:151 (+) Transcript_13378:138-590(+)|eukprot:CEM19013.1 unnamed protein product [Vitrella brassicaformis CCMP3155]
MLAGYSDARLERTLYVGGLDTTVTRDALHAAFIPFGEIRNIEMPLDMKSGNHRGFGFVEFEDEGDALEAIDNMNESELYGKVITVNKSRAPQNAKTGRATRPVWADDIFYRKRMAEGGMEVDVDKIGVEGKDDGRGGDNDAGKEKQKEGA